MRHRTPALVAMSRRTAWTALAVMIMIGSGGRAGASQASYTYVSMEELVQMSSLVLVVSREDPPMTVEMVRSADDGSLQSFVYERRVFHFRVAEELANTTGLKFKGPLSVLGAHDDAFATMKKYHQSGLSITSVFQAYRSQAFSERPGDRFIIFLNISDDDRPRFSVEGAYEAADQREKIIQLIGSRKDR